MERVIQRASEAVPFRPLGLITNALEEAGFKSTFVYDDLIFVEYNVFLLRMEDIGEQVRLFFNVNSDLEKRDTIARKLISSAEIYDLLVMVGGTYELIPDEENETIDIRFFDM